MAKRKILALVCVLLLPLSVFAQDKKTVPPGTPVTITVQPAAAQTPPISIILGPRHGHVTPERQGCTHTGGGNIDVSQPTPDTVVITMSGAVVAYGALRVATAAQVFDLEQCLELSFDNPKVKKGKLTLEGRVIGLLRSHCHDDSAGYDDACASVGIGPNCLLKLCVPPHSVGGTQNLSVNDHDGPISVPVLPGKYVLHQTFRIGATAMPTLLLTKGPSAEFAPDPALDPLWISYKEPFHGAVKKDFGFQITLKVAEDTDADKPEPGEKDKTEQASSEKLPQPSPVGNK